MFTFPDRVLTLSLPSRLVFGAHSATDAVVQFAQKKHNAAIITTDAVQPAAEALATALRQAGVAATLFVQPAGEPTFGSCAALIASVRSLLPDLVLGIGGGSILDVAKLVAALHDGDEPTEKFVGTGLVPSRHTSLVCVPTTAGTGSEVSPNSLLLDEAAGEKKAIISPLLVPDLAIVDPALMLSLPPAVTATTGIDALAHCLEPYASLSAHPVVDPYALEGVRLIGKFLPQAVADGQSLTARSAVALGSLYGGLSLGPVNTNGVHALAYPLGGMGHLPHALSIALMLPHVVAFNCSTLIPRHAALARALGSTHSDEATAAAELPGLLRSLMEACRIPMGLAHHGIARSDLPRLAEAGLKVTRLLKANPRPITHADALRIFEAAF